MISFIRGLRAQWLGKPSIEYFTEITQRWLPPSPSSIVTVITTTNPAGNLGGNGGHDGRPWLLWWERNREKRDKYSPVHTENVI